MCVACCVNYDDKRDDDIKFLGITIRYFIGGWKNFHPKRYRGEGDPAPWLMIWTKYCGLQIDSDVYMLIRKPRFESGFWQIGPVTCAIK